MDQLDAICNVLGNPGTRALLGALSEPRTAQEAAAVCDLPVSTTYRRIEQLQEAGLIEGATGIRDDHHVTVYRTAFDEVRIRRHDGELDVTIERSDWPVESRRSLLVGDESDGEASAD